MNALQEFISVLPRDKRRGFREFLATALGVSEPMVRHMANGNRRIAAEHVLKIESAMTSYIANKANDFDAECVNQIEKVLGGKAPRHRLRPDLYPDELAA